MNGTAKQLRAQARTLPGLGMDGTMAVMLSAADEIDALRDALTRTLSWLTSYPGGGPMGHEGAYEQARAALGDPVKSQSSQGGGREHAPGCKSFEEPGCDCGAMLP